jgi:hypothetical protein
MVGIGRVLPRPSTSLQRGMIKDADAGHKAGHGGILFAFGLPKQSELGVTYCQRQNMISRQRREWQVG